jgi:hypothetical protein
MIRYKCEKCGISLESDRPGEKDTCPQCGQVSDIPMIDTTRPWKIAMLAGVGVCVVLLMVVMTFLSASGGSGSRKPAGDGSQPSSEVIAATTAKDGFFVSKRYGFRIMSPAYWAISENHNGAAVAFTQHTGNKSEYPASIGINAGGQIPVNMGLDEYVKAVDAESARTFADFRLISSERVTLDGRDAQRAVLRQKSAGTNTDLTVLRYIIVHKGRVDMLICMAATDKYDKLQSTFDHVCRSFELYSQSAQPNPPSPTVETKHDEGYKTIFGTIVTVVTAPANTRSITMQPSGSNGTIRVKIDDATQIEASGQRILLSDLRAGMQISARGGNGLPAASEIQVIPAPSTGKQPTSVVIIGPSGWKKVNGMMGTTVAFIKDANNKGVFQTNINVYVEGLPSMSRAAYLKVTMERLSRALVNLNVISSSATRLGKYDAQRIVFTHRLGAYNVQSLDYVIIHEGRSYILTCQTTIDEYRTLEPLFESVCKTFAVR